MGEGNRLRVAVVGLGIGQAHVFGYTRRRDLFDVVVVCDPDETRTGPTIERINRKAPAGAACRTEPDVAAVASAPDVDVVSVCTPPFLHFEQVGALLAAGKHVVCEKPLVGSLAQVDELGRLALEHGVQLMPVFQYRYGRGLQRLRALVDAGLAGDLYTVSIEVAWRRRADYYAVPWRGRWATELGGLLLSHCVHAMDMATYVAGDPTRVFARCSTRVNDIETEDCASASVELAGGAYLTLSATLGSAAEISRHRFCFSGLVAESNTSAYNNSSDPWTFTADDPGRQAALDDAIAALGADGAPSSEEYQRQFELFHASIHDGAAPPVTVADARRSIELVTAMYASARGGGDVALPIPPTHPFYGGWQP